MKNKKNKRNSNMYGEFVCSEFRWIYPYYQKKKARELEKITRDEKKEVKIK